MKIINKISVKALAKLNNNGRIIFRVKNSLYFSEGIATIMLSIPIIIGELIQMMVTMFGSAIAGRLSYQSLAAVSLVNGIINIPFIFGVGITLSLLQGITVFSGQKNDGEMIRYFFNAIFIISVVTGIFAVLIFLLAPMLLFFQQDKQVILLAIPYLRISGIVLIPALLYLLFKHFIDGQGDTRVTLFFSLLSVPVNLFLLWSLGVGKFGFPKLSLIGIGLSSAITNCILLLSISMLLMFRTKYFRSFRLNRKEIRLHTPTMVKLLKNGIPISVQLGVEIIAFAVASLFAGSLGSLQQAAHQIVFTCMTFLLMVVLGLAQGNAIRIGMALGEKKKYKIAIINRTSITIAIVYTFLCGLTLLFCKKYIPLFFVSNPDVIDRVYPLLSVGFCFLLLNNIQIVISSSLRGISDLKYPTIYVFVGYWLIGLPLGYFFLKIGFDVIGIWIGLGIGLGFTIILSLRRLKRKLKYLRKMV